MPSSHFICAQKDDKQWQIIRKNSEVKQCMFFSKCYTTFKLNCLSLAAQPTWEIWTDEGKRPALTHLYFQAPVKDRKLLWIKWTNQIRNQKSLRKNSWALATSQADKTMHTGNWFRKQSLNHLHRQGKNATANQLY